MEGGVALFLLLIIVVVAAIAGLALYLTGGAIIAKSDVEKEDADEPRPEHERPTSPTQEKGGFAGPRQEHERSDTWAPEMQWGSGPRPAGGAGRRGALCAFILWWAALAALWLVLANKTDAAEVVAAVVAGAVAAAASVLA